MAANSMIRSLHGARNRAGMDEDSFRDWLERDFGSRHLSELDGGQLQKALKVLNGRADTTSKPAGHRRLAGSYAGKLQALWLSAWNLGIVRNKADEAMLAFIERQTKIQRTEFLRDPKDARKAVEALKSWIAREGGVDWASHADPQDAVIAAQMKKLGLPPEDISTTGHGIPKPIVTLSKIVVMRALGERIRGRK